MVKGYRRVASDQIASGLATIFPTFLARLQFIADRWTRDADLAALGSTNIQKTREVGSVGESSPTRSQSRGRSCAVECDLGYLVARGPSAIPLNFAVHLTSPNQMQSEKRNTTLPDVIDDPVLGRLSFSAALNQADEYQAKLKLGGRRVTIDLYTDADGEIRPCILRARRIAKNFPAIQTKMHAYIAKAIFPTYNETFRRELRPFSIDQVVSRLKLRIVTTHPEPRATFWLDAGNVFSGHGLQLYMVDQNKFLGHDMPG